jgi:photosystem II stability/assembly factor-like uncharacterized protein
MTAMLRAQRWVSRGLLLSACALLAGRVQANGRFPAADQLVVDPADATKLALRATFGVLVSGDQAQSWQWICEEAVGYASQDHPTLLALGDGTVLAGLADGLRQSNADGCDWERVTSTTNAAVIDLVTDPADTLVGLALLQHSTREVRVAEFREGQLREIGASLGDDFYAATLEIAASDPERLYVSGLSIEGAALFFRSVDRGESWERFEIALRPGSAPYISAVDPTSPDRVYVRADGAAEDALLVSDDGGESFEDVLTFHGDMLGFALSPNGSQVIVGGPGAGLKLADTEALQFEAVAAAVGPRCLTWRPEGLYACGNESLEGWTVGFSNDGGVSFEARLHLDEITPQECAAATGFDESCPAVWPAVRDVLGIEEDAPAAEENPSKPDGCGCRIAGGVAPQRFSWALLAMLSAIGTWILRRSGRKTSCDDKHPIEC